MSPSLAVGSALGGRRAQGPAVTNVGAQAGGGGSRSWGDKVGCTGEMSPQGATASRRPRLIAACAGLDTSVSAS